MVKERPVGRRKPVFQRALPLVLFFLLSSLAFLTISQSLQALDSKLVFRKDYLQDYLIGKAVLEGEMPYQNISNLKKIFYPDNQNIVFDHPTPHPPTLIPILIPLSLFDYQISASLWLIFSLLALVGSVFLLSSLLGGESKWTRPLFVFLFLISADPIRRELIVGQYSILILFLILLFVYALRKGRFRLAGVCLGLSFTIKLFGVFLFAYLFFTRKWLVLLYSLVTYAVFFLISLGLLGFETIVYYFSSVVPKVKEIYAVSCSNISLTTIGNRLFVGTDSSALEGTNIDPLMYLPKLSSGTSVLIASVLIFTCFRIILKREKFELGIAVVVLLNIIISPISWTHSVLVAFCPLAIVCSWEKNQKSRMILVVIAVLFHLGELFRKLIIGDMASCDFFRGLVTLTPLFISLFFLFYLLKIVRQSSETTG